MDVNQLNLSVRDITFMSSRNVIHGYNSLLNTLVYYTVIKLLLNKLLAIAFNKTFYRTHQNVFHTFLNVCRIMAAFQ